jgi:hypothetical protein
MNIAQVKPENSYEDPEGKPLSEVASVLGDD